MSYSLYEPGSTGKNLKGTNRAHRHTHDMSFDFIFDLCAWLPHGCMYDGARVCISREVNIPGYIRKVELLYTARMKRRKRKRDDTESPEMDRRINLVIGHEHFQGTVDGICISGYPPY